MLCINQIYNLQFLPSLSLQIKKTNPSFTPIMGTRIREQLDICFKMLSVYFLKSTLTYIIRIVQISHWRRPSMIKLFRIALISHLSNSFTRGVKGVLLLLIL